MPKEEGIQLVISGFKNKKQAEAFMNWYEGQGEQDACLWFEEECGCSSMMTKCPTHPPDWRDNQLHMTVEPVLVSEA